jgi:transcriptional regulator with XRE-family HTH domain
MLIAHVAAAKSAWALADNMEERMGAGQGPTVQRRRLGSELRRYREAVGLTIEQAAELIECSDSKISRIETGRVSVRPLELRELCRVYGIPEDQQEPLHALSRQSRQRTWWQEHHRVLSEGFRTYLGLEADAHALRTFEISLVPGLLQTGDYARALLKAGGVITDGDVFERLIRIRMTRQELVTRQNGPLRLHAVIDEAVLRRTVGDPALMGAQLEHLRAMAELPNVTLRVVPFSTGLHPGMDGPFTLLEFADPRDPDLVYVEGHAGPLFIDAAEDVARCRDMFGHLDEMALPPRESTALIEKMSVRL